MRPTPQLAEVLLTLLEWGKFIERRKINQTLKIFQKLNPDPCVQKNPTIQ